MRGKKVRPEAVPASRQCGFFRVKIKGNEIMKQARGPAMADDLLGNSLEISAHTGIAPNKVTALCETGALPAFRIGPDWCMRRSTYRVLIERLEEPALSRLLP